MNGEEKIENISNIKKKFYLVGSIKYNTFYRPENTWSFKVINKLQRRFNTQHLRSSKLRDLRFTLSTLVKRTTIRLYGI